MLGRNVAILETAKEGPIIVQHLDLSGADNATSTLVKIYSNVPLHGDIAEGQETSWASLRLASNLISNLVHLEQERVHGQAVPEELKE